VILDYFHMSEELKVILDCFHLFEGCSLGASTCDSFGEVLYEQQMYPIRGLC
jgi:hypothetical protein